MTGRSDIPLRDFLAVWWQAAIFSMGGPAAQIGVMQRLVVDERGWLTQDAFNHALNFCLLLPGPEAQQLATYIGWRLKGVAGGVLAGVLFVLPGALIMLGLSLLYVTLGQSSLLEGLLFGLQCAVLAIVAQALCRMSGRVIVGSAAMAIAGAACVAMLLGWPFPLIILLAAGAGWWVYGRGERSRPVASARDPLPWRAALGVLALWLGPLLVLLVWLGRDSIWTEIAGFFSLVSVLSFGGAYAVLAWVAQFAAETRGWIVAEEMLDGLGLAETTPGPLILVTQWVGFLAAWRHAEGLDALLAGSLGGLLTTWVMFAPSFLWIFLFAPWVERLRTYSPLAASLRGVTAAVVGVIAFLALWFGMRLLFAELHEITVLGLTLNIPSVASVNGPAIGLSLAAGVLLFVARLSLVRVVALTALAAWLLTL